MKKRKMEKDYHELAENRGFDWVGEVLPKNTRTKTWWECRRGHRWAATYGNIYMKTGCPFCSKHIKKTRKDYRNVGNNKHKKYSYKNTVDMQNLWLSMESKIQ